MNDNTQEKSELLRLLNAALAWEMRAEVAYSHYAAYVKGIHRLHLRPYFEAEAAESVLHGKAVREQIVKLGGIATTDRDPTPIVHTTDYRTMLGEAYQTETKAADGYKAIMALPNIDSELYDAVEQISFEEERSVEELSQLIES